MPSLAAAAIRRRRHPLRNGVLLATNPGTVVCGEPGGAYHRDGQHEAAAQRRVAHTRGQPPPAGGAARRCGTHGARRCRLLRRRRARRRRHRGGSSSGRAGWAALASGAARGAAPVFLFNGSSYATVEGSEKTVKRELLPDHQLAVRFFVDFSCMQSNRLLRNPNVSGIARLWWFTCPARPLSDRSQGEEGNS
jgi:hypothetical protein